MHALTRVATHLLARFRDEKVYSKGLPAWLGSKATSHRLQSVISTLQKQTKVCATWWFQS
jgi:hypothetical protein